jgi:hypothetical protein
MLLIKFITKMKVLKILLQKISVFRDSHHISLIFKPRLTATLEQKNSWMRFLHVFFDHINFNRQFITEWKSLCKLESNKKLPYLNRAEGGLGGDDNHIDKQIRFPLILSGEPAFNGSYINYTNKVFIMDVYNTSTEKWTFEELDDLVSAFKELFIQCHNGENYISGTVNYEELI